MTPRIQRLTPALGDHRPPPTSHFVVTMRCCRAWPISIGNPVGRCGLCGAFPA